MMPSSHDITPEILPEFMIVLKKLLRSGNNVLIVSKPHIDCIKVICNQCADHTSQIMFRFTIGSTKSLTLAFWEPYAPGFDERLECLKHAFSKGFQTSVSCEPYLDAYVARTYTACRPYITDSFWVGKLRGFNTRVKLKNTNQQDIKRYVDTLKQAQSDSIVRVMYSLLKDEPFIRWKDSIRDVIKT